MLRTDISNDKQGRDVLGCCEYFVTMGASIEGAAVESSKETKPFFCPCLLHLKIEADEKMVSQFTTKHFFRMVSPH